MDFGYKGMDSCPGIHYRDLPMKPIIGQVMDFFNDIAMMTMTTVATMQKNRAGSEDDPALSSFSGQVLRSGGPEWGSGCSGLAFAPHPPLH